MIKVSVFYPYSASTAFDINYYCNHHMPLVKRLLGTAVKGIAVEQGLSGTTPGSPPLYHAMGHLLFDSTDTYRSAFGQHAQEIIADVPNYTNSQPTIQVSEIKM